MKVARTVHKVDTPVKSNVDPQRCLINQLTKVSHFRIFDWFEKHIIHQSFDQFLISHDIAALFWSFCLQNESKTMM